MVLSSAAFERIGVHLAPAELDQLVTEAVAAVLPHAVLGESSELAPEEVAALERGGLRTAPPAETVRRELGRSAAAYAALVGTAYTVAEAARLLRVDASRVRHRLAARMLYGLKHADGWRLPRFQFEGGGLVPGIERIFPQLPSGLHALAVAAWFSTPDSELVIEDIPLSPRDWLLAGGAPAAVAPLAAGLGVVG